MRPCDRHRNRPLRRRRRSLSVEDYALANSNQFYDRTRPMLLQDDDDDTDYADNETDALFGGNGGRPDAGQSLRLKIRQFFDTLRQQRDAADQQHKQKQHMQSVLLQPLPAVQPANDPRAAALKAKWTEMLAQRNVIPKDRMRLRRRRRNITPEDHVMQYNAGELEAAARLRKHCPTCSNGRREDPCSICGGAIQPAADLDEDDETLQTAESAQAQMRQLPSGAADATPMYVEFVQGGQPVPYQLGSSQQDQQQTNQPRYVFDRLGHRYIESDGRLRLIVEPQPAQPEERLEKQQQPDPFVGSGSSQPSDEDLRILSDILKRNQGVIQASNIEGGHLIERPTELAQDVYQFMHGLNGQDAAQPQIYDYRLEQQQQPQWSAVDEPQPDASEKRSYHVVPLLQDRRDGSVLVRLEPRQVGNNELVSDTSRVESKTKKGSKKGPSSRRRTKTKVARVPYASAVVRHNRVPDSSKPYSSLEVQDYEGNGYDIVSLNGDSAQRLDSNSQEFEILRLIYDSQTANHQPQTLDSSEQSLYDDGSANFRRVYAAPLPQVERVPERPAEGRRIMEMRVEPDGRDNAMRVQSSAPVMADFET